MTIATLSERLHATLPQTQCTRCGYADCRGYAQAIAQGDAGIDQCPPGGAQGVERLARLTGRPVIPLNPAHGAEGPRMLAVIDEDWCIGCTLCIEACPVDCIVGASRQMHTVVAAQCTGCELCIPVCPVDCIALVNVTGERSGWAAWSEAQAQEALGRYESRRSRQARDGAAGTGGSEMNAPRGREGAQAAPCITGATDAERKRATIAAVLARARGGSAAPRDDVGP